MMWLLCLFCLGSFLVQSTAFGFFNDIVSDTESCNSICEQTYPLHTYDTSSHLEYCYRGCRLFTIIDFVSDDENLNHTREACDKSCQEAYNEDQGIGACKVGCESQMTGSTKRREMLKEMDNIEDPFLPLYPFIYVHNWYSDVFDRMAEQATVTWSFYVQGEDGKVVVHKSQSHVPLQQPRILYAFPLDVDEDVSDYKTSNYLETNLAFVDNSATPNLKHSQVQFSIRREDELAMMETNGEAADWLSCISKKTGFPRILLTCSLLLSAVVMIWLCFTSAATAPDQRVRSQQPKLSINGDAEFLKEKIVLDLAPIHLPEKEPLTDFVSVEQAINNIKVERL